MTEDQIEPLCVKLYVAIRDDKRDEIIAIGFELLAGFLVDINRLAWFTQQIAESQEATRP